MVLDTGSSIAIPVALIGTVGILDTVGVQTVQKVRGLRHRTALTEETFTQGTTAGARRAGRRRRSGAK